MQIPPLQEIMPRLPIEDTGAHKDMKAIIFVTLFLIAVVATALIIEYRQNPQESIAVAQTAAAGSVKDDFADVTLTAKSAVVLDLKTNKILFSSNPDVQLPLASLTKVPLAIVVSEVLAPDSVIRMPRDAFSSLGIERLSAGERWSVKNVTDFTLVASSNQGAEILASIAEKAIRDRYPEAEERDATLWRMNQLATELGLTNTYFLNESGLDVSESLSGAYGSSRDMAILFCYAASWYRSVFNGTAQNGIILEGADGSEKITVYNTNVAIGDLPGLIMGKTGITDLAGGNLAVVFDAAPAHPIVAVVLGSTRDGRFNDMKILVERARKAFAQK